MDTQQAVVGSRAGMSFAELFEQVEQLDEFRTDELVTELTEELSRWMETKGISRSELAKRLGNRPSYVTKVLKGDVNFTLATVAKLCKAIGVRPRLHLAPEGSQTVWYDAMEAAPAEDEHSQSNRRRA